MNVIRGDDSDRCPTCGLSRNPETADLVHVRLGLDEPPEPLVCKCKPAHEIMNSIMSKTRNALRCVNMGSRVTMETSLSINVNTAMVVNVSRAPIVEVEARLNAEMSRSTYSSLESGMFGPPESNTITEVGCSWWTGPGTNMIARLRVRNHTHMTAKIVVRTCQFMPGIMVAISYEYPFEGEIMRPEYITEMSELSVRTTIQGVDVILIARRYECEDTVSYSSEIEFMNGVGYVQMARVINMFTNLVGSIRSFRNHIKKDFMDAARHTDHVVIDVTDLNTHKGTFMFKADGMKVYVFCYPGGYVVTQTDDDLTVISYWVSILEMPMYPHTDTPDILVAEMMTDGSLVYIDTLAVDGITVPNPRAYATRPMTVNSVPPMIVRRSWNEISEMDRFPPASMESDGVVCVTGSRTLRMKKPTIDLMYRDRYMHASRGKTMVRISDGHQSMNPGSIYEMSVAKGTVRDTIQISNPVRRLVKRRPNNTDIVTRAFMSVSTDSSINTILYDVTIMSFKMRRRVYEMAQTKASVGTRVIVIFGAGRFQEINEMKLDQFSYIAIDPQIDVTRLKRHKHAKMIVPYDVSRSMSRQVIGISRRAGNVLYYAGKSEAFITQPDVGSTMTSMGIPGVFSFSISYHIMIINSLRASNVSMYGCGFVHDNMPMKGVGITPVTMNVVKNEGRVAFVRTEFGKSVYEEPILRRNSVKSMHPVRDVFPELWSDVDASTIEIMSRAVLMY